MADLARRGKGLPQGKPPAGKDLHCFHCGADGVTNDHEDGARPGYFDEGVCGKRPGWLIPCPGGCGHDVFLDDR
jgi:hypothetical protein